MHVPEMSGQHPLPNRHPVSERYDLPVAPLAMPDQVLERGRENGVLFAPLLRWFAWK